MPHPPQPQMEAKPLKTRTALALALTAISTALSGPAQGAGSSDFRAYREVDAILNHDYQEAKKMPHNQAIWPGIQASQLAWIRFKQLEQAYLTSAWGLEKSYGLMVQLTDQRLDLFTELLLGPPLADHLFTEAPLGAPLASQRLAAADRALNAAYQKLLTHPKLKVGQPARPKLVAAQAAWMAFRDLDAAVLAKASVRPMAQVQALRSQERTAQLVAP